MTSLLRRLAALTAVGAATLTSGCISIINEQAVQVDGIGGVVRITGDVCFDSSYSPRPEECTSGQVEPGRFQVLLAARVPAGVTGPETFTAPRPEGAVTVRQHAGYAAELQRTLPAGDGMQWLGYVSDEVVIPVPEGQSPLAEQFPIALDVSLPAAAEARAGRFRYQLLVGYRRANDEFPATRPAQCADVPGEWHETDPTLCLDLAEGMLEEVHELALGDVALAAPGAADVAPGAAATLPFTATFAGAPAAVGLTAATDLPGATVAPAAPSLSPPAAGTVAAPVTIHVPAGAPAGRYAVTLTAASGAERRSATATVVVPAPAVDTAAPVLGGFRAPRKPTRAAVARRGLKVTVTSSEPVALTAVLEAGKALRRKLRAKRAVLATARAEGAGALTLTLRPAKAVARRLRGLRGKARVTLRFTAKDAAGNAATLRRAVTLR